jgi:hypothetical protein
MIYFSLLLQAGYEYLKQSWFEIFPKKVWLAPLGRGADPPGARSAYCFCCSY